MKIYVLAGVHGDELFGLNIIGKLQRSDNKNIRIRIGHPEAIAKAKRFIGADLNRSFNTKETSIEATLAHAIQQEIRDYKPDLVIDIHTSITDIGKIAIIAKHSPFIEAIAAKLGMNSLVIMPTWLVNASVIGCLPDRSISLEFGKNDQSDRLATTVARSIQGLSLAVSSKTTLPVYEVHDHIDKNFAGLVNIQNLTFNAELDGYPFLAGPATYEEIGGFLARKIS